MRTAALCFTIVGLLLLLPTLCTLHYVVFEEVGQVVTSVSYLHVTLPLNLTSLSLLIKDHLAAITQTKAVLKMVTVKKPQSTRYEYEKYREVHWQDNYKKFLKQFISYTRVDLDNSHYRGEKLQARLRLRLCRSHLLPALINFSILPPSASNVHCLQFHCFWPKESSELSWDFTTAINKNSCKKKWEIL